MRRIEGKQAPPHLQSSAHLSTRQIIVTIGIEPEVHKQLHEGVSISVCTNTVLHVTSEMFVVDYNTWQREMCRWSGTPIYKSVYECALNRGITNLPMPLGFDVILYAILGAWSTPSCGGGGMETCWGGEPEERG